MKGRFEVPRFFVAMPLPEPARDRLIAVQPRAIPGMRLVGREELHLTLHFLGELAADRIDAVRTALTKVEAEAFAVAFQGVGQFPSEGLPQVLWAGIEPSAALTALHCSLGNILTNAIGYRPESRPYSPHVALAWLNSPAPSGFVEHYFDEKKGFVAPAVLLDRFALYSSSLAGGVPRYEEQAVFPLRPCEP